MSSRRANNNMSRVVYMFFIMSVVISIFYFRQAITNTIASKNGKIIEIEGNVVDYEEEMDPFGASFYYPIFEYQLDGEHKRYAGNASRHERIIGPETWSYNTETGRFLENQSSATDCLSAIFFGLLSVAILAFSIIS